MIQFNSILPVFQAIALVVILALVGAWLYRKEQRGRAGKILTGIRIAALTITGLLILNPVMIESAPKDAAKPALLVLLDDSHSMAVQDVGGKARLQAAIDAVFQDRTQAAFSKTFTPTFFAFNRDAVRQDAAAFAKTAKAEGAATFIGGSLSGALGSAGTNRTGAVLIVSDGRDNGDIAAAEVARQSKLRGYPVYTVCVGKETKTKDLSVMMNRPQVFTSPNQEVALVADIASSGYSDVPVTVELQRESTVVSSKTVTVHAGSHAEVSFDTKEAAKGTYRYTVAVRPLGGEVTNANNKASTLLTVGNATTRVLVLEGHPTWDAKFMIQAMRSDPSVTVDTIFKLTDSRTFAVQGAEPTTEPGAPPREDIEVPKTRADFAKYDVVVIGKGFEEFFAQATVKELEGYVSEDGGHLIFLRGAASERAETLASLEPITWGDDEIRDFRMKVTEEGASNPAFGFGGVGKPDMVVNRLPTLVAATRVAKEKALTVVLARATGEKNSDEPNKEMALFAYQRYGDGLVMSLIGNGLWRWALLPPNLSDYTKCYNDFWTQMVRWMVNQSDFLPGQNLSLRTDHFAYAPGEAVNLMLYTRGGNIGAVPPVTITGPNGAKENLAMSKGAGKQADFIGTFRPRRPGEYIATMTKPGTRGGTVTAPFSVYERKQEDMNTSADPGLMAQIAQAGGGKVLDLNEIAELPRLVDEAQSAGTKKPEPKSLWDRWEVLATILGLLGVEWIVRRRMGLI